MSEFTLIWTFRNRLDEFKKSIYTAHCTSEKDLNFCLVDASSDEQTIRDLRDFVSTLKGRRIRICESHYRTSWHEALNLGMILCGTRYALFTSSDCYFLKLGWFEAMSSVLLSGRKYCMISNHSLFGVDKALIADIGWFDERFRHGPHTDTDYMIRASEARCVPCNIPNCGWYSHQDPPEVTIERGKGEVEDRLDMHDLHNERFFKEKWSSDWPGWEDYLDCVDKPHPPTTITQCTRMIPEIDPYPIQTAAIKVKYVD